MIGIDRVIPSKLDVAIDPISQICKKLVKCKSTDIIASEIEEDEAFVKEICSIAEKYLPDYDEDKIYDELKQDCV